MKYHVLTVCCMLYSSATFCPIMLPKIAPIANASTPKTTPAAKTFSISIPIAYDLSIINVSKIAATLNAISIKYSTSTEPGTLQTVSASTNISILPGKGISFTPQITINSTDQNISTQFEGISGFTINSQSLPFAKPSMGTSPFYIDNVNGSWKLTTKPAPQQPKVPVVQSAKTPVVTTPPIAPTTAFMPKVATPVMPKAKSIQSTAVPYLQTTGKQLPKTPHVMPKVLPAIPPMPVAPKVSAASNSAAKAINQTLAKQVA